MATPGKYLTDRERQRIRDMHRRGVPTREIARALLVHPGTVNKIVRKSA